jgi:phage terminase large subunit GpA-like protein
MVRAACRAGLQRARRACAEAIRCRPRPKPSCWIRQRMRLDDSVEAGSGRYDIDRRPWWIPILDAFDDPDVMSIAIAAATQIGKTLSLIALILWAAENDPSPMMLVAANRDDAIELRNRIYLNALATVRAGGCHNLRVPPEHKWNTRYIDLGACRVYLAWAGSLSRLRGRPCKRVFLTEVAVYPRGAKRAGNPISAAHQRIKAFFRGFLYQESSPAEHPCPITELEQQATARYRWRVACPHCGVKFELRFFTKADGKADGIGGIRDADGECVSSETARADAHYLCPAGCRIENSEKQAMLESGQMEPLGEPVSRRKLGFHLWSIHSESITFGDLAAAYLEAKAQLRLAEFWGNWLGLEYKPPTRVPEWQQLGRRNAARNLRGQVPCEAWFLTGFVDVQAENSGVRVSVRGWAPGRTSWLVDWRWLERDAGDDNSLICSDLAKVTREVLGRKYAVVDADGQAAANPLGRRELSVKLLGVDVGYLPRKVLAWLHSLPESWWLDDGENVPRVRPQRGDHQLDPDIRFQSAQWEQNVRTGEAYENGGMTVWRVNVASYWDVLTQLLCAEPHKTGGWHVTADCLKDGKAFLEQVVNYSKRVIVDPDTGRKKTVWGPRHARTPHDYWSTSVGELVCADMVVGDLGWDPQAWEPQRQAALTADKRKTAKQSAATRPASLSDRELGGLDDR